MVNTVLPEDLVAMGVRCYIHDAMQLRWAGIGVEDAKMAKYVEMSILQWRQLSEDPERGWRMDLDCACCNKMLHTKYVTDIDCMKHRMSVPSFTLTKIEWLQIL